MKTDEQRITGKHLGPVEHPITMDRDSRGYVYRGAQVVGLDKFLEAKPLKGVMFSANLRDREGVPLGGRYDPGKQTIEVNTLWTATMYGAKLTPGFTGCIAETAETATGAMQRTFVHELGHHIQRQGGPTVAKIVNDAFFNEHRKPITTYAKDVPKEYFSESLAAYTYHRKALQDFDPVGYSMVEAVLREVGVL